MIYERHLIAMYSTLQKQCVSLEVFLGAILCLIEQSLPGIRRQTFLYYAFGNISVSVYMTAILINI